MDITALLQTFGFPVALAIALIYWWRRDYADLVKRVRQVEEARAAELKAYANSYKKLAEQVVEALEQHNMLVRQQMRENGQRPWNETDRHTPQPHPAVRPEKFRTPLPFPQEGAKQL